MTRSAARPPVRGPLLLVVAVSLLALLVSGGAVAWSRGAAGPAVAAGPTLPAAGVPLTPSGLPSAGTGAEAAPTAPSPPATGSGPTPTSPTPVAPPRSAAEARLRALVPQLQQFVSAQRGLSYTASVRVDLLDDAAFQRRLLEVGKVDAKDIARNQATLVALGLLPPGTDLSRQLDALLAGGVIGFYDPKTAELVVRGAADTPATRRVLVHELTHALQDQVFDLDRPEVDAAHDEQSVGLSALAEGDAVSVDSAYVASLPPAQQTQARATGGGGTPKVAPVLLRLLQFPYSYGPELVADLRRAGGQARLDAAFRSPPVTSEQVLHPERFLAGEGGRPVTAPAADGQLTDDGILGELGLRLALQPTIGLDAAARASDGWGGDRYVTWTDGARTCLRDTVVGDDPTQTAELRAALTRWAKADGGVRVSAGDTLTWTSCH